MYAFTKSALSSVKESLNGRLCPEKHFIKDPGVSRDPLKKVNGM